MSKQRPTLSKQHSTLLPKTATMSNEISPCDKVETNLTCSICFDFVEKNRSTCSIRQCCFDIVAGVDGALDISIVLLQRVFKPTLPQACESFCHAYAIHQISSKQTWCLPTNDSNSLYLPVFLPATPAWYLRSSCVCPSVCPSQVKELSQNG